MKTADAPISTQAAAERKEFPVLHKNPNGLHARPCALLVKTLRQFSCEVVVECHGEPANSNSIMGLMALAAGYDSKLTFIITGNDAAKALAALRHLFESRFHEAY